MQKRTRIFTVVTLLTGLLLGLGALVATFGPAAVQVGASSAKKHHPVHHSGGGNKGGGKTSTSTTTSTTTTTFTFVPPPPQPCFVTPNPVHLSGGSLATTNVNSAGYGQFEVLCNGLNESDAFLIKLSFPSCDESGRAGFIPPGHIEWVINSVTFDGGANKSSVTAGPIFPDTNGNLQLTVILQGCEVSPSGTITLVDSSIPTSFPAVNVLLTH